MTKTFDYAWKEISKRKKKYMLNVILIALVVVMLITLNSLGTAYKEASRLPFEKMQSSIIIQKNGNVPENTTGAVTSCSLAPIRNNLIDEIETIEGIKDISYGLSLWVFDNDNFKRVLGVNWDDSLGTKLKAGIVEGEIPQSDDEVLIEKTYAEQYNLKIEQKLEISEQEFRVSGIVKGYGKDIIASDFFMNLESAQGIAFDSKNLQETEEFNQDDINIIFVDTEQTKINAVAGKLKNLLNQESLNGGKTPTGKTIGSYNIYTPESFENQISSLFVLSDKLILFISIITIIGSVLIIMKSMSHAIIQRKKEFGIMKSIGFTKKDIQKEIGMETILQVFAGYILGIIVSFITILLLARTKISISIPWELNPYPHFLASNPNLVDTVQTYLLPIQFQPAYAILSFVVVIIIGILTAIITTNQINKLKAMEVLKNE
ncbi:ABC transporter permease [archaeon]|jgi:putative ABC transport system permease protein|nr:ABC transporter permease [archaeon]MBT7903629.1 ABC transporter permease [Candidatus Woesearchaeota archaeon]MBT4376021.1 ABC transporter permease [archaeon]MBT4669976.1 ABC transporter permease [archaeon]MBT5287445.1 ABC transporter permease [archaeon]